MVSAWVESFTGHPDPDPGSGERTTTGPSHEPVMGNTDNKGCEPLGWKEAGSRHADEVRRRGAEEFLKIWREFRGRRGYEPLWGDESQWSSLTITNAGTHVSLSLRQAEILRAVKEVDTAPDSSRKKAEIQPEYEKYMIESTPSHPYGPTLEDFLEVEGNMKTRRRAIRKHLLPNETVITLTSFPRLGVTEGQFSHPSYEPEGEETGSLFLPDEIISQNPKYTIATGSITDRRGSKISVNLPVFVDSKTPRPFIDNSVPRHRDQFPEEDRDARESDGLGAALPDHIYIDSVGFGAGCCSLQTTFQASDVDEARKVYDALVPVAPIMMALTAAAPIYKGFLADVDCRWDFIGATLDDRTEEEKGLKPLKGHERRVPKPRWGGVDSYLSLDPRNRKEYNDGPLPVDEEVRETLTSNGVDELMSSHIAHLFIRDPLIVFSDTFEKLVTGTSADSFENIQSTNWQSLRFKPPPLDSPNPIGWRVEFRSMEVQLTDSENAAFSIFVVLLARAVAHLDLNLYIPITKVEENIRRANTRNASREQRFFFRKEILTSWARNMPPNGTRAPAGKEHDALSHLEKAAVEPGTNTPRPVQDEYAKMTMDEIVNGTGDSFPGLMGVVDIYLSSMNADAETRSKLQRYLNLVRKRADGTLMTTAQWIRRFVREHPEYHFDSVVSQEINYDLCRAIDEIQTGKRREEDLLGKDYAGEVFD